MQDPPTPGAGPGRQPSDGLRLGDTFLTPKKYPTETAVPVANPTGPPEAPAVVPRGVFRKVVLPLALFVALVAAVAWVSQYLPSWRKPNVDDRPVPTARVIEFPDRDKNENAVLAIWDLKNPKMRYVAEYEQGTKGHYDFFFENVTAEPAELGLGKTSCGCTNLEVCLLSAAEKELFQQHRASPSGPQFPKDGLPNLKPQWQVLTIDEVKGVVVPPSTAGLVRLNWDSRKPAGETVRLQAGVWTQPQGQPKARAFESLGVMLLMVTPVRFYPERAEVGALLPKGQLKQEFWCWSSTRDAFDLHVVDNSDPCLAVALEPLTEAQCKALPDSLDKTQPTRVRSGYRVSVTLFEEKDGHQLDMGHFQRSLPLMVRLDGVDYPDAHPPVIVGTVRADVKVMGTDPLGKIDLKTFTSANGSKAEKVLLFASSQVRLEAKTPVPPFLKVDLQKKETKGTQTTWELEVSVPPGRLQGELGSDSAVILQSVPEGRQPRRIRLPVTGTAVRGAGPAGRD